MNIGATQINVLRQLARYQHNDIVAIVDAAAAGNATPALYIQRIVGLTAYSSR